MTQYLVSGHRSNTGEEEHQCFDIAVKRLRFIIKPSLDRKTNGKFIKKPASILRVISLHLKQESHTGVKVNQDKMSKI